MTIRAVDHVNIRTTDLETTRAFFADVLGLKEGPRPDFVSVGYWFYAGSKPVVHIQQSPHDVGASHLSALNHVSFEVADLDAMVARLERHGVDHELVAIPGTTLRQVFFLDPNGVRLELNEAP